MCDLLWSVVLVKARAMGSAGNRLLLPSPSHGESVSADRKTWGEEFGEAPKCGAGGAWTGLTLGMSPGAAAAPSLLPHTRKNQEKPGKTRHVEVTTQVSPSHLPSKSFSRLLPSNWDVLRENITRGPSCVLPSCAPLMSSWAWSRMEQQQLSSAAHRGDSVSLRGRGTGSKPTL